MGMEIIHGYGALEIFNGYVDIQWVWRYFMSKEIFNEYVGMKLDMEIRICTVFIYQMRMGIFNGKRYQVNILISIGVGYSVCMYVCTVTAGMEIHNR